MKTKLSIAITALSFCIAAQGVMAADQTGPATELKELVTKVREDLKAGKKTEADLADDLKSFDTLLAKHKDEKTDDVAQILYMKAMLYKEVLKDDAKCDALLARLKTDFPQSKQVKMLAAREESEKTKNALAVGTQFPDFSEKDVQGKPMSVGNYKGKVVLVDFWATWCGPCVAELPNVLKTYQKHHPEGFDIVGVSLDQDQDKLTSFTRQKDMTWQQYFDGKGWGNKLAGKYGIDSIPATFLLNREGKIIAKDLRGEELETAVSEALARK